MIIGQQGSSLGGVVDWPFVGRLLLQGTIDQTTGSFMLAGSYGCSSVPADGVTLRFSGTTPGDGTFTGTVEAVPLFGSATCAFAPVPFTGSRVSTVCGNGSIDPGEACDPGGPPENSLCCTLACQAIASGSTCSDDGLFCTTDVCDGAGTCTHPPGHTGAICRAARFPCDVAEVCDGVSPNCPADQPTCPPPDIDVNGMWRVTVQNSFVGPLTFDISIVQTGTDLVVDGVPGSLDPVSRDFSALAGAQCQFFVGAGNNGWTGTFDPTGETFSGAQHYLFEKITPPPFCSQFADPATGVRISTSPDCGNGVLDAGEACDPGTAGSTCCDSDCTPKPAGTVCRQQTDDCDVPETCDGALATCPANQRVDGPDGDGDGLPDACDACIGGPAASKPGLKLSAGKLLVRGRAAIPGGTLDPITNGVRLLITSAAGTELVDVTVPGGELINGRGWKRSKNGWRFASRSLVGGAVNSVSLTPREAGALLDFKVAGKRAVLPPPPPDLPLRATLVLDPPQATSGLCTDAEFPGPKGVAPTCVLKSGGRVVSCR
jgi:hypothetical protein